MSTQDSAEDPSPGRTPRQASPHDVIGVGVAFSAAGLYFMLGAAGYAPMPEGNSPAFIAFCADGIPVRGVDLHGPCPRRYDGHAERSPR